jgi:N-acetylmuramoyl-L-alanine amidase
MRITDMLLTNQAARPGTKITPKGVVMHWTANTRKGANAVANRNYFNNPATQASAHYIVDDAQIVRCLPETEMGYHVGAKSYKPEAVTRLSSYPNNCTIGIEMCVNADGQFPVMYRLSVELAADILHRYGWGVDRLWRHYDITGKNCPAFFVSDDVARKYIGLTAGQAWDQFKSDVHSLLAIRSQKETEKNVETCTIQLTLSAKGRLLEGVSYLPVRAVAEAAGASVGWDPDTKKVTVNGRELAVLNDHGISYAAARDLAAVLGLWIAWDHTSKTVMLGGQSTVTGDPGIR